MDSSENNLDNYALYIFLFLSLLSVGNDFFYVYQEILEKEFIKNKVNKFNDYYNLFGNLLCNNVKKVKNKMICYDNKDNNKEKEDKKDNKDKKDKKEINKSIKKIEKKSNENKIIDEKTDNIYENNINIMKNIVKKEKIVEEKKNKKNKKIK